MCKLWKKTYLCGCSSHLFRDRCTTALRSPTDTCEDCEQEPVARKSYFPCYDHINMQVKAEKQAEEKKAKEEAEKAKKEVERVRAEKAKKEEHDRMQRLKDEEAGKERERRAEVERQKRESGGWVTQGGSGGRKSKGKRGGAHGVGGRDGVQGNGISEPSSPLMVVTKSIGTLGDANAMNVFPPMKSAPAAVRDGGISANGGSKENGITHKENNTSSNENGTGLKGNTDKMVDPGGRAGRWGPSTKTGTTIKILKPDTNGVDKKKV